MKNPAIGTLLLLSAMLLLGGELSLGPAATWQVGPTRVYKNPSEVSTSVGDGDTVEIDAGTYRDVCSWSAQSLVLKGVGGKALLNAAGMSLEEGKARGDRVLRGGLPRLERRGNPPGRDGADPAFLLFP
ncbi:MAG: hypothetical protein NTV79_01335 [Candidatus Aureabacteria bacterium]|nr:hypothetical protein [Candidatus Auribacterota bacterium]